MEKKKEPVLGYLLTVILTVVLDQWMKAWVVKHIPLNPAEADKLPLLPGIVRLSYIQNRGAAFSSLEGARWFFLLLLLAFTAVVIWALARKKLNSAGERWMAVVTLGGALGNGIDRALKGYVVDMFEVEFMDFAIFNVADIFVVVGAIVFILFLLFAPENRAERKSEK